MEPDAKAKIDEILADVNSIEDITLDKLGELKGTLAGRFAIEKFKVDWSDWANWSDQFPNVGRIEYDAQNSHLIIKATGSDLHEAATGTIGEWLLCIRDHLSQATGTKFACRGTTGSFLDNAYLGSEKAPDQCLKQKGKKFPLAAVEVAVSETSAKVFDDAKRWLDGSSGMTKLVIVVDIKEKKSKESSATTNWGLSEDTLGQLRVLKLADHILQWHQDKKIPLVGRFEAFFYLCFQGVPPRRVWSTKFSLNEPASSSLESGVADYITAKDLIPELHEAHPFPLPLEELATNMHDSLVDFEIHRASKKAHDQLKAMAKIAK